MARYDHWFSVLKRLEKCGVIPTVNLRQGTVNQYMTVAMALIEGGIDVIEILYRAEHDERPQVLFEAISAIRDRWDTILVGCGTLQTAADTCAAIAHGAQFIVSNTRALEVVEAANVRGVVVIPAAETQEDVRSLLPFKPLVIKLFMSDPLDIAESIERLRQFRGCYPRQEFTVTGVKNPETAKRLLETGYPFVVTGAMVANEAMKEGHWGPIAQTAKQYSSVVEEFRAKKASHAPGLPS